jgi:hypothetical protein
MKNYLTDSKRADIRRAFQWVVIYGREFQEREFFERILPAMSEDGLVQRNYHMEELTRAFKFNLLSLAGLLAPLNRRAQQIVATSLETCIESSGDRQATDADYHADRMIEALSR